MQGECLGLGLECECVFKTSGWFWGCGYFQCFVAMVRVMAGQGECFGLGPGLEAVAISCS